MNKILTLMMLSSLAFSVYTGKTAETAAACFDGANDAVLLVLSFGGIMCLWTGILKVAEKSGAAGMIARLLRPVIRTLFPGIDMNGAAVRYITLNMTANILGLGNGATPMGIKAMAELEKEENAHDYMCFFAVLNTAAFQLIPTTVMALRNANGGKISIIYPVWITSAVSLAAALTAAKIMCFIKRRRRA